ncbi:methyltransferase domain-containing protein [Falsiroseomonas selenitidurans]|uniref:Methyltransferase domain-containing protein n=1 Tax=Falsiroseomonas selenitidurans TaxID=2716335 RepID=A0ABX1E4H2_9PROT|nr:methyltransferase domain-containing protein [Falsiroseomonas selenitidurans]NKC29830.1 methyltransferase domain-containing protein [Falsiroseomonas selenitidurans]
MAQASADALLREGAARHARGELALAERLYRRALAARPCDANALNLLSVLARQRGALEAALALSAQAVAAQPDSPVFLASRGATLAEAGRLEEAAALLRAALARRPTDATALRNLGQVLCALGRAAEAVAPLTHATELAPAAAEPWIALAHARREAGQPGAAAAARHALALPGLAPGLAAQARFLLAALGEAAAPDRAPAAYVRDLFDQYAPRFDADLQDRLGYRTPALLAALLVEAGIPADATRRVLDLGCGTGLSGLALKPFAARMKGVDLSPRMLAEAARRGLYDRLQEADLLDALAAAPGAFDLVAAVDVLNYLGDLGPALSGIARALAPGGVAAFSLEAGQGAPFALGEGLRYRHDPAHVLALAAEAGLAPLARREAPLREEKGVPVAGVLLLLGRTG